MSEKSRVVHYINQFFAGMGGEEHAGAPPERREGPVGPGRAFQQAFANQAEIVATIICGDAYFSEQPDQAADELVDLIVDDRPHLVIAGPAFDSGRYGLACGKVCVAVHTRLGIPAVTGLHPENPAAEVYAAYVYITPTGNTAATMRQAVPNMAHLALKLARGQTLGKPSQDHYLPRGRRRNVFTDEIAARRAVRMLLGKVKDEPFETELVLPNYQRVPPAACLKDLAQATIVIGTEGGMVPSGNPDRIEAVRATKWAQYPIEGLLSLAPGEYESAHGGYDARYSQEDPNRMVPVDGMRALEGEGKYAHLYPYYFATVGCGMPVETAAEIGQSIAQEMKAKGIDGIVLTAT